MTDGEDPVLADLLELEEDARRLIARALLLGLAFGLIVGIAIGAACC